MLLAVPEKHAGLQKIVLNTNMIRRIYWLGGEVMRWVADSI